MLYLTPAENHIGKTEGVYLLFHTITVLKIYDMSKFININLLERSFDL